MGCLIFERMDQIDFMGPFEVLSHMPDTTIQIIGKELAPLRDVQDKGSFDETRNDQKPSFAPRH